jgi:hypothetical protein
MPKAKVYGMRYNATKIQPTNAIIRLMTCKTVEKEKRDKPEDPDPT